MADAYNGIFKYNPKTDKTTILVDKKIVIEGRRPQLFNSVEVSKSGIIFWTDSSTEFTLEDGIFSVLADGTGR